MKNWNLRCSNVCQQISTRSVKNLSASVPYIDTDKLIQINPKFPHVFGLHMTHKTDVPLQPVVSFHGAFGYKLSKFLAKLAQLVGSFSKAHINSSATFIDKSKSVNLRDSKMLSFDVFSLFTKVPIDTVF